MGWAFRMAEYVGAFAVIVFGIVVVFFLLYLFASYVLEQWLKFHDVKREFIAFYIDRKQRGKAVEVIDEPDEWDGVR